MGANKNKLNATSYCITLFESLRVDATTLVRRRAVDSLQTRFAADRTTIVDPVPSGVAELADRARFKSGTRKSVGFEPLCR